MSHLPCEVRGGFLAVLRARRYRYSDTFDTLAERPRLRGEVETSNDSGTPRRPEESREKKSGFRSKSIKIAKDNAQLHHFQTFGERPESFPYFTIFFSSQYLRQSVLKGSMFSFLRRILSDRSEGPTLSLSLLSLTLSLSLRNTTAPISSIIESE